MKSKWPSSRVPEDKQQDEREMKLTLTIPSRFELGSREGPTILSWMTLFNHQEETLKVSCCYLYSKCVKNGGFYLGAFGGH